MGRDLRRLSFPRRSPTRLPLIGAATLIAVGTPGLDPLFGTIAVLAALALTAAALFWPGQEFAIDKPKFAISGMAIPIIAISALLVVAGASAGPELRVISLGLGAVGVLGSAAAYIRPLRFPLLVAAVGIHAAVVGGVIPEMVPTGMDVHMFNREAADALLSGQNPYEIQYQNIIGEGTPLYAPELQVGSRLTFGYPYPPLSLLMVIPGHVLGGDYRFALLVAVEATAILMLVIRPDGIGAMAATLLLVAPISVRVILNGWVEPFVGVLFAALVTVAVRLPRLTPLVLGLAIAVKQYVAPLVLLAVFLLSDVRARLGWRNLVVTALAVLAATVLPFLIWSPRDFMFSTLVVQILQPLRPDSMSVPAAIARLGGPELPGWLAFLAAGLAMAACYLWANRTPAGLATCTALVFMAFFVSSKQGALNYYYFVLVAVLCGLAASTADGRAALLSPSGKTVTCHGPSPRQSGGFGSGQSVAQV